MAYTENEIELRRSNARKTNSKLRPNGYIYILKLQGSDIYKIGVSANPKRRMYDIDSVMPFETKVIFLEWFKNVYNMEECIHDSFDKNLMRREWFKIHPEDIKTLKDELREMSNEGIFLIKN